MTGAFFMAIEAGAWAMVGKSAYDLSEAKGFRGDSLVVTSYPVDTAGAYRGGGPTQVNSWTNALVRARRLHLEDWVSVVVFNHLIAGAEAFVSANLWDLPGEVTVRPSGRGAAVSFSAAW